ncbi:hypothetical protein ACFL7M_06005 [Thermodesulfobacteriota bacterium]
MDFGDVPDFDELFFSLLIILDTAEVETQVCLIIFYKGIPYFTNNLGPIIRLASETIRIYNNISIK